MYFRQEIGKWGENLACEYLKENGYQILEKNFRCKQGEIDIVAQDNHKKELVFFEVKTRSNFKYGNPAEAVNLQKQRHIKHAVKYYIYKKQIYNVAIRIDVIEIYIKKPAYKINHIKQILL